METQVKSALNISENIHFSVDDYRVYEFLISELMKPVLKKGTKFLFSYLENEKHILIYNIIKNIYIYIFKPFSFAYDS